MAALLTGSGLRRRGGGPGGGPGLGPDRTPEDHSHHRGRLRPRCAVGQLAANFVVTISFLRLLHAISAVGAFFLFGFLTLAALGYFWRKVPKSKGASLEQIEQDLADGPGAVESVPVRH